MPYPCAILIPKALDTNSAQCFQRARKKWWVIVLTPSCPLCTISIQSHSTSSSYWKFFIFSIAVEMPAHDSSRAMSEIAKFSFHFSRAAFFFLNFKIWNWKQYGSLDLHYFYGWAGHSALCTFASSLLSLRFVPPLSYFTFLVYLFSKITFNSEPVLHHS